MALLGTAFLATGSRDLARPPPLEQALLGP